MTNQLRKRLNWIDAQEARMVNLVMRWARIGSGSLDVAGLARMTKALRQEFGKLGGQMREVALPPWRIIGSHGDPVSKPLGKALVISKRPRAATRILLNIHMDTVYGPGHHFNEVKRIGPNKLRGPGVADAKGGLVVMLIALEAMERELKQSRAKAPGLGWEVVINPDEELGSPGSAGLLAKAAKRNHFGLLFEPAFADGSLVNTRKGSGNFALVVRGKAAHVGRDYEKGRNAIHALARLITQIEEIPKVLQSPGVTVNVGKIEGGGPVNVVPDLAITRFNVRVGTVEQQRRVEALLGRMIGGPLTRQTLKGLPPSPGRIPGARRPGSLGEGAEKNPHPTLSLQGEGEGLTVELHGGFGAPPKVVDERSDALQHVVEECGQELDMPINWRESGGVSDGNRLAAAGLPNVDTMGVVGGHLHSDQEYMEISSLVERAKLAAMVMMELGARS